MIYGSICSGIEAATVAWHPLGWRPAFFAEIDKAASSVLAQRFPEVPNLGDFTQITPERTGPIDLLVGGTPCQDFSLAGLRKGLAGDRGNLSLEFVRLAERFRSRWLAWENVPGVLSSNDGRDFAAILGGLSGLVITAPKDGWENAGIIGGGPGYGLAWRVLDAQFVRVDGFERAVPQRRRRVFVVGYFGDWRRAAAVLFERESLLGNPAPRRQAGKEVAGTLNASLERCSADEGERGNLIPDVAAALDASYHRLQGASGQDANHGHSHLVAFGGNNTAGPIDVATAVRAHGGPCGHIDFESETFVAFSCKDYGADADSEVSPVLRAMGHDESHANAGGQVAVAIQERAVCENPDAGPDGIGVRTDGAAYTLEARTVSQAVCFESRVARNGRGAPEEVCPPLKAQSGETGKGDAAPLVAMSFKASHYTRGKDGAPSEVWPPLSADADKGDQDPLALVGASSRWSVRRLMPVECERLQGFSDGHTAILDKRGKVQADGPRYKQCGNSMAVNVMRWIGRRIEMVERITGAAA